MLIATSLSNIATAQLIDNFSDGDFSSNPTWNGDAANFIVNPTKELQLNATLAGVSQLYTNIDTKDSMKWEFYTRLTFAPSATNRVRIFLVSDSTSLIDGNGYYIEIGDDGATDAIKFYNKKNGTSNLLISGTTGAVSTDPVNMRLLITKTKSNLWTLKVDLMGTSNFQKEFDYQDISSNWKNTSQYFGFQCIYTVTRKDKFYFDDIKIDGYIPIDNTPPIALNVLASDVDNKVVSVFFDENISSISANNIQNYLLDNTSKPTSASININNQSVDLTFANDIAVGTHTLTIIKIADIVGNINNSQTISFTKQSNQYPQKYDIIINEIMADPTPVVGLPDAEWVELYNRSKQDFNLKTLSLKSGTSLYALPDFNLQAGGYVVICAAAKKPLFTPLANIIGTITFPVLSNTGDDISIIENKNQTIIDQVIYIDDWYGDAVKKNGGFSLELINPNAVCNLSSNWTASNDLRGGTPAQKNSIISSTDYDLNMVSIVTSSANTVDVVLNKKIGNIALNDIAVAGLQLLNIEYISTNVLRIRFNTDIEKGKIYTLMLKNTFSICDGSKLNITIERKFGLSEKPITKDIIINEVLFNPNTSASRFVELYNRSNKIINLKELALGAFVNSSLESYKIDTNFSLYPGEFVVLTDNITGVTGFYFLQNKTQILKVKLPKMNDDGGNISVVLNGLLGFTVLDSFEYNKNLHNPLIDIQDGVSLERVNYEENTNDKNNWQSAANSVGNGTPTYQNSQYRASISNNNNIISLDKTTFSPDGDAIDNFLTIHYNLKNNATGSFWVYDPNGRLIKTISKNNFLAAEGNIVWNGDTDSGTKAPIGVYTIYTELIMDSGSVERIFKNCVLASKF